MIRKLALAVLLIGGLVAGTLPALAQTNALNNLNSLYGNWVMTTSSAVPATGANTVTIQNCYVNVGGPQGAPGNRSIFPLATNVPITVVDGSNTETVTPSAVSAPAAASEPAIFPYICSFTATFSNTHGAGVQIVSADGGRAEAANDNGAAYPLDTGAILLSGHCTGTVGSAATDGVSGVDPTAVIACSTAFAPTTAAGTSIPRAGVIKALSATSTAAGTNSSSGVVTLYKNGSASALTCTIGTATSCVDNTHTVSVVAGDVVTIGYTTQTSDTLANMVITVEVF